MIWVEKGGDIVDQEQLSQLVEKIVLATLADNEELVVKGLAQKLNWTDHIEHTICQAAFNSVKISTNLSVQIILELLLATGAFKISEEFLRPQLTVIKGGADPEFPGSPS